jgi:hypothetical protein
MWKTMIQLDAIRRSGAALARCSGLLAAALVALPGASSHAQVAGSQKMQDHDMQGHDMAGMNHDGMAGMAGMDHSMAMTGLLGPYPMTREASGTAWQPDSAVHNGWHFGAGDWMLMAHGYVTALYDRQGGPRGDSKVFSESMGMLMASRAVGEHGTLGLRAMLSLDPLMGRRGYPLLFATGETADGKTGLVDRQHPHDLFMELAASYAYDLGNGNAVSIYAGLPGEPALGVPTFMHRVSGMDNPEAPIGHHWFDSTHVTFGVVTAGYSTTKWKLEASAFKGREPDQHRYDIEAPKLDSWSVRAFFNPDENWSLQASTGHLKSPEQLEPERNEQRTTFSATFNKPIGEAGNIAATLAYSIKDLKPGPALHAWLAEADYKWAGVNTVFARAERVQENELFVAPSPLTDQIIPVNKLSVGYARTFPVSAHVSMDIGGLLSTYAYPQKLTPSYGGDGVKSFMLFAKLKLGG